MHSDPIADLLTRIRNAGKARQTATVARCNNICFSIAEILAKEGYIAGAKKSKDENGFDQISIKLDAKNQGLSLKRISKPGQRIYVPATNLPKVLNGLGIAIISTSKGVMTNRDAHAQGLGGEVLCEIW